MPRKRPPYIRREETRHGKMVWTFRRGRGKDQEYRRLPDAYGTQEFWAAYNAALEGKAEPVAFAEARGTLAWLVKQYKASATFARYAKSTRRMRDAVLEGMAKRSGHFAIADITRASMQGALEKKAHTPNAANNSIIIAGQMFKWAVKQGFMRMNPCDGVDLISVKTTGFHTWTPEEVETYRARHPVGTMARLALDLLLFLGLRRSDVIHAGRQHVRDGVLSMKTQKTGAWVHLTICDELAASINATKTGDLAFLETSAGRPFSSAGSFGNWFRTRCDEAGLPPECSAHGVRKAGATIAANNGATPHQLMAMFGWTNIKMAERYTKDADKVHLARGASERIASHLFSGVGAGRKNVG